MNILTAAHLTAFGSITHVYASVEFGIKATLAGVLEVPLVEAMIVTEPYSASTLKNVAKSLAKISSLTPAHERRFIQIVGDWSAYGPLRNQIAHCRWQKTQRPGAIRPVGVDIRSGTAKWIATESSKDWTAEELAAEASKLVRINERLQKLHAEAGMAEIMDKKADERKQRIDALSGIETSS